MKTAKNIIIKGFKTKKNGAGFRNPWNQPAGSRWRSGRKPPLVVSRKVSKNNRKREEAERKQKRQDIQRKS